MKKLNIFIDETGNFGFKPGSSRLYGISFVFHDTKFSIENELNSLNNKLKNLNHYGMLHFAHLIAKHGEYFKFSINHRHELFWDTMRFIKNINIKVLSIIVDKSYMVTNQQLKRELILGISNLINKNKEWFDGFDKIDIYYDDGQKEISKIIKVIFANYNYEIKSNFCKINERLFQVADMLTCVDKIYYKKQFSIPMIKSESLFFSKKDLLRIIKELKNKRL